MEEIRPQIQKLAQNLLGPITEIVHQPYGHGGLTFEIRTVAGDFILKTRSDQGAFDHTEHHIRVLSRLGITTPTVLAKGRVSSFDYILLIKIPGLDLGHVLEEMTSEHMTHLAERIVEIERLVTGLPKGRGFGWTPMNVPGPFASWTSIIERDSAGSPVEVRDLVANWTSYLGAVQPTCFLDDLTVKNVIIQDGVLKGIVDLDFVCYGDPLYWLSLAEVTSILDVGIGASFYGEELRRLWGMTDETNAVCNLYNVIQSWFFLGKGIENDVLRNWSAGRFADLQLFAD